MLQRRETVNWCHERGVVVVGCEPAGTRIVPSAHTAHHLTRVCVLPAIDGSNGGIWQVGRRRRPELDFLRMAPLQAAANAHSVSVHQVSLRWSLQRGVAVIPMSFKPAHQRENLQLFDFALSPAEMGAIDALGESAVGSGAVVHTAQGVDRRSLYGFIDPEMIA